jgi:hypothetical protein
MLKPGGRLMVICLQTRPFTDSALLRYRGVVQVGSRLWRSSPAYLLQFLLRFQDAAEPFATQGHVEVDAAEIGFHLPNLWQFRGPSFSCRIEDN